MEGQIWFTTFTQALIFIDGTLAQDKLLSRLWEDTLKMLAINRLCMIIVTQAKTTKT
jgi:hypothetical protein